MAEAEIRAIITPISSVTGASIAKFENPTGPEGMDVAGVGTDVFSWGKPLSQGERPNQFAFTGKDFETSTEVPFTIGTFEYYNGTVGISTQADTVDLEITVSIPDLELETFVFPLEITGTPNNSDREASADIVRIVEPVAERTIELDGRIFAMRLAFGDTSENGFSEIERFFVFEDSSAQADLKATLTEVLPPIPVTLF